MKKALVTVLAAAAVLTSCQMAEDFSAKPISKGGRTPLTFAASIETPDTRASLIKEGDVYHPTWQAGARIEIKGLVNSAEGRDLYSADEGGSNFSYFTFFAGDTLTGGPYEAYAPVNAAVAFPGTQSQVGNVCKFVPMRAFNADTTLLAFKNLGGLLQLNVKTSQAGIVVKQIIVTADQPMAGPYTLDGDAAVIAEDGQKSIVLDCGNGIEIGAAAAPFYISIPANTYTGMTIQLIADGGKKSNVLKMKSGASFTVERSKYYEAEFSFDTFETVTTGGEAILCCGKDFNAALKQQATMDDLASYSQNDYVVTKIVFDTNSANTNGVDIADLSSDNPVYLSVDPSSGIAMVSTPASQIILPSDASYMFAYFGELEEIVNLKALNTENVEDMSYMFCLTGCSYKSLKSLDLSNFNTSVCSTMRSMFNGCSQLTELNVSSFNTENVETLMYMFQYCEKLKTLDVSNFNTENCTDFTYVFGYCYELESITGLKNWNVENGSTFKGTFGYCYALTELDLEGWDTSSATYVCNTFWHCHSLTKLNTPNFSFASASDVRSLYNRCDALEVVDVSMLDPMNSLLSTSTTYTGYFFYLDHSLREIYCGDTFMFPNRSSYFMCGNNAAYEKRPGSNGGLTIYCTQDIADWFATTGLRWIAHGYNSDGIPTDPIPVTFLDYQNNSPISVTFSAD